MAKPSLTSILADTKPESDSPDAGDDDADESSEDPKTMAAETICEAIENKDYAALASALSSFIDISKGDDTAAAPDIGAAGSKKKPPIQDVLS